MKKWSLLIATTLLLVACNNDEVKQKEIDDQGHEQHVHMTGDIQEETKSAEVLPSFLDEQTDLLRATYQIAGQAPDILQWMPCYCGCGDSVGHKSNLNCFVQEIKEDGSVIWDDHGTRCNVCVEIALSSVKMHQEGKSLQEIRQAIDEYYKEGYATPTPTEIPA